MARYFRLGFFLFTLLSLSIQTAISDEDSHVYDMAKPGMPLSGIMTGGQPSRADLEKLIAKGLKTVIDLRLAGEPRPFDEPATMAELGIKYIHFPVRGRPDLTREMVMDLDKILKSAKSDVLIHCARSNRVGAVLALRAFWVQGQSKEEALDLGRKAGLESLASYVEKMMETSQE